MKMAVVVEGDVGGRLLPVPSIQTASTLNVSFNHHRPGQIFFQILSDATSWDLHLDYARSAISHSLCSRCHDLIHV